MAWLESKETGEQVRASIRIYAYKLEIKHSLAEIQNILDKAPNGKVKLRTTKQIDRTLWSTFKFEMVDSDDKKLVYAVHADREVADPDEHVLLYHDVCFTSTGYLIITGMPGRNTLLECLTQKLHPDRAFKTTVFLPWQLDKGAMQAFVDRIIIPDINRVYRPGFHSPSGYRNRDFHDFVASDGKSATDDSDYETLLENCQYFDPIFKVNRLCGEDFPREGTLKAKHDGYFYCSRYRPFKTWLKIVRQYLPRCLE